MKMKAAVLWELNTDLTIEEVDLDGPREGEVLVSFEATGICHSDHHGMTGDMPFPLPANGGHEGAGIVMEVGPGVRDLEAGDHVVASFLPACGRCRWCATGQSNLCDLGALIMSGTQIDGTYRRHLGGRDVGVACLLGTYAQYGTVSETSLVKIDVDLPLARACLVGCGVTTGWGSAVNTAKVSPGDTVVVIGCGGVGSGAIQGARLAGAEKIVVVDLVETKRDRAIQFGATHFVTSMPEATALVAELTRGVMADSALLTVGVAKGPMIDDALNIVRKGGAVVLTALASMADVSPTLSMTMFTLFQKRLLGSLYGEANPRADIPRLLSLYREGKLLLDEAVTSEYKLDDINDAFDDMLAGRNIRGRHRPRPLTPAVGVAWRVGPRGIRVSGSPRDRVGSEMSRDVQPRVGFSDPRRRYLVEWYRLDLEDDALGDVVSALDESAARIAADGSPVELVAMLAAPSDEVVFGVFAADSADVVAETCDRANFPAQRLTAGYDACDRTRAESVDHQSRAHARRSEAAHRSPD